MTPRRRKKTIRNLLILWAIPFWAWAQEPSTLVDQTVAIVGREAFTLWDVEVDFFLTEVLERRRIPATNALRKDPPRFERAREDLTQRALTSQYLRNTGAAGTVPAADVSKLWNRFQTHFQALKGDKEDLRRYGLNEEQLRSLLKDRLRVDRFLEKHLRLAERVTEEEVRNHYDMEKNRKLLGKPFEQVKVIVREDLKRRRRTQAFSEWLEAEKKRTQVVLLPLWKTETLSQP